MGDDGIGGWGTHPSHNLLSRCSGATVARVGSCSTVAGAAATQHTVLWQPLLKLSIWLGRFVINSEYLNLLCINVEYLMCDMCSSLVPQLLQHNRENGWCETECHQPESAMVDQPAYLQLIEKFLALWRPKTC